MSKELTVQELIDKLNELDKNRELRELLDKHWPLGTVVADDKTDEATAEIMTKMMKYWRDSFIANLETYVATETAKARISEVHKFLNRSDSLGEAKYATRRIAELELKTEGDKKS